MSEVKEVFDVKQYPLKYGEITKLEERVTAIEKRFSQIYEKEEISGIQGYKTSQGIRFFVNGIYEWNAVFLEYGEDDGDMFSLEEMDEAQMFEALLNEIRIGELDVCMARENAFRIYKTFLTGEGTQICFRFWGSDNEVKALYSHNKVLIDGCLYNYRRVGSDIGEVIIPDVELRALYDHWIKFV